MGKKLFVGIVHKCSIEDWFLEAWRSEGGTVFVGVKDYLSLYSVFITSIFRICYLIWLGLDVSNLHILLLNFSEFREWTQEWTYLFYVKN